MCHNGNIVNANEIRDRFVKEGSIFQTNGDTEMLVHLYARSNAGGVEGALVDSLANCQARFRSRFSRGTS